MTVDEYLEHQPEEETADFRSISSFSGTEVVEVWSRIWWRLLEEQFLFWYLWLKDNFEEIRAFVQEVKVAAGEVSYDGRSLKS
ncbi:hypothetical protein IT413_05455 [Candidatus Peregrinibacteria bacterium]|nr:hypothetical protein [Candidatus Peregrinibacteria bacterium]